MTSPDQCRWDSSSLDNEDLEEEYSCDRSPTEDGLCELHSPKESLGPEEVGAIVEDDGSLIGANVHELDLSSEYVEFEDNRPINLTGVRIRKLTLDKATITNKVVIRGGEVEELSATHTDFEAELDCRDLKCETLDLSNATIHGDLLLEGATVNGDFDLVEASVEGLKASNVQIDGTLSCRWCSFSGPSSLVNATVKGEAYFDHVELDGKLSAGDASFESGVEFEEAEIRGRLQMNGATIDGNLVFTRADFGSHRAEFVDATIQGLAKFDYATSTGRITFFPTDDSSKGDPATIADDLSFKHADLRTLVLKGVNVGGSLNLCEATLESVDARNVLCEEQLDMSRVIVRRSSSVAGATVGGIVIRHSRFHAPAEFADIDVEGELNASRSTFHSDVDWEEGIVEEASNFERCRFHGSVTFSGRTFRSTVTFHGARFEDVVTFEQTKFEGPARFSREGDTNPTPPPTFDSDVSFHGATFEGAYFSGSTFRGPARFNAVTFEYDPEGPARVDRDSLDSDQSSSDNEDVSESEEETKYLGSIKDTPLREEERAVQESESRRPDGGRRDIPHEFNQEPEGRSKSARVDGTETKRSTGRQPDLQATDRTVRSDRANPMRGSESDGDTSEETNTSEEAAERTERKLVAAFDEVQFDDVALFEDVSLKGPIEFKRASVNEISLKPAEFPLSEPVSFRRARIDGGEIHVQTGAEELVEFDFTRAKLGDVDLQPRDQMDGILKHCRIDRTEFVGFNFLPYAMELRARSWSLHTVDPIKRGGGFGRQRFGAWKNGLSTYCRILRGDGQAQKYETLRATYQYAKKGASLTGQNEPASGFFQREMQYQGRQLACEARDERRITSLLKCFATVGFGLTSRYGESGIRVTAISAVVVVLYTALYLSRPDVGETLVEAVVLSLGAFATLLVGGVGESASQLTALVAASQGFVGALLVALLLFTLTRSIHR